MDKKILDLTNSKDLALILSIETLSSLFLATICRKAQKKQAIEKRKLCIDHYIYQGHHVALYEKILSNGESIRWTERVDKDPFGLYRW